MNKGAWAGFFGIGLVVAAGCTSVLPRRENPWVAVRTPVDAPSPRAIGEYSAGCLRGGAKLPAEGPGYRQMRAGRRRIFGHPPLLSFIERLGAGVARDRLGLLHVGDLGLPRGGPTDSNHRSHQNGLDVDIWFLLDASAVVGSPAEFAAPSVVSADGESVVRARFTGAHISVLRQAVDDPAVERIFVNAAIKRDLCVASAEPAERRWLHKLRPWYGHDDHFHVRLVCPAESPECKVQTPVPAGDGCDATLSWWFSEEARAKAKEEGAGGSRRSPGCPRSARSS